MAGDLYIGMVFGGFVAAFWSFLMARYVAGPRAKQLMVGTLRGDTSQDKLIVAEIRENLIRPEIDTLESKMPVLDLSGVTSTIDGLSAKFTEFEDNNDFSLDPLLERLDRLETGLPDMIGTHVSMAIKNIQAQEVKSMQSQLSAMGIEGVIDESKQAILAQIPQSKRMMTQFMNKKLVSKSFEAEHPDKAMLLEIGRIGLATLLEAQEEGALGMIGGNGGARAPQSTGFGVRG